jgi:hypothetical protein
MYRLASRGSLALAAAQRSASWAEGLDPAGGATAFSGTVRGQWEEALLLAEADPERAREVVRAALRASPAPEVLADHLRHQPEFAPLRQDQAFVEEVLSWQRFGRAPER